MSDKTTLSFLGGEGVWELGAEIGKELEGDNSAIMMQWNPRNKGFL